MITVIDNLFPQNFNKYIIERLRKSAEWRLCLDDQFLEGMNWDLYSDTGLVFYSYHNDRIWEQVNSQDLVRGFFNNTAELILNTALASNNISVQSIDRVMWNYYSRSSTGIEHKDAKTPGTYSMIYNLVDTSGGTYINGDFYQGLEGRAIIFPSDIDHRGTGSENSPYRFVLNVIFSTPINCES